MLFCHEAVERFNPLLYCKKGLITVMSVSFCDVMDTLPFNAAGSNPKL